jgi:hypothetical protein
MSVLTPGGYFTISGLIIFILFIIHSFAYYAYRSKFYNTNDIFAYSSGWSNWYAHEHEVG